MVSKYGGVGNTPDAGTAGGGGSGWPRRRQRPIRVVLCVGFVAVTILFIVVGVGIGPYYNDSPDAKKTVGDVQKVGAVRRALGEKEPKGGVDNKMGVTTEDELSDSEKKERDAYFRSVTCKNDHVVYTRQEALTASTTSQIPKDKLSVMTPLKGDTVKEPPPLSEGQDGAVTAPSSPPRIIITIHRWVLDVTAFLQFHPGGKMLLEGVGKADSAGIFMQHHGPGTASLLQGFCIGVVKG